VGQELADRDLSHSPVTMLSQPWKILDDVCVEVQDFTLHELTHGGRRPHLRLRTDGEDVP